MTFGSCHRCLRRLLPLVALLAAGAAAAQEPAAAVFVGKPVGSITLQVEGEITTEPSLVQLIPSRIGEPLSMTHVRESLTHLISLGRFQDVRVEALEASGAVALTYHLVPLHGVTAIDFAGELALPEDDLRRLVTERYGAAPSIGRADAAARTLEQYYETRGFLSAQVRPEAEVRHDPDRTILRFHVEPGVRAQIATLQIQGVEDVAAVAERLGLKQGVPYDRARIEERLGEYESSLRRRGYYEASADHLARPREDVGLVDVILDVQRGPIVRLAFEGDRLPEDRIPELVPVEREGSVDEDLLEDSDRRIREYLHGQGYWRAEVTHRREQSNGVQTITFAVRRGARYIVDAIEIAGNRAIAIEKLRDLMQLAPGEPFVASQLDADVAAIRGAYRQLGFAELKTDQSISDVPSASRGEAGRIVVRLAIAEGVQSRVGSVRIEGNRALGEAELRAAMRVKPGDPFFEPAVAADRESVLLAYLDRGYQGATVAVEPAPSADRSLVDLTYRIQEASQVMVDHVIIVGNVRTSEETIRRELLIREGQPLGMSDLIESRRRLSALGLFRRVRINEVSHGDEPRRDIVITVEEANRTTITYGGGVEAAERSFIGPDGQADEQVEIAPRGSFEIGRRNLWGRNRSLNLFSRLSFRPRGESIDDPESKRYGFNEYRVVGTYREIGAFNWNGDIALSGFIEQAVRTSFNFGRKGLNAELQRRMSAFVRVHARYGLGRTKLFDERIPEDEQLDVDRLFPQVRLSSIGAAVYRDTRDDPLDPVRGALLGTDAELSARAIGSQVGFAKIFVQAFGFRRLPTARRMVLAGAVRAGLARGFEQVVQGEIVIDDLPASERFFAGGSTTVRGFETDKLGAPNTITEAGFPRGGNAMLVLNLELRSTLWRDLGIVGFFDVGNVFARVADVEIAELRASPGFGLHYRSPFGPIRVDLGFKLRPRELSPGNFESRTAFHISVGHAF
jgi:outer membrane protein insertion porin family